MQIKKQSTDVTILKLYFTNQEKLKVIYKYKVLLIFTRISYVKLFLNQENKQTKHQKSCVKSSISTKMW